jgi:hypothetical protein
MEHTATSPTCVALIADTTAGAFPASKVSMSCMMSIAYRVAGQ